VLIRQYEPLV